MPYCSGEKLADACTELIATPRIREEAGSIYTTGYTKDF